MKSESENYHALWQDRITESQKAGLSQAEYCRRNNLKPYLFTYWKRKLRGGAGNNSLVEIPMVPAISRDLQSSILEIRLTESLDFSLSLRISSRILDAMRGMNRVSGS